MAELYDMAGQCCGNFDGDDAPDGYWLRDPDAPVEMAAERFITRLGPERLFAIFAVAQRSPAVLSHFMLGVAKQSISLVESFPILKQLEDKGVVPAGTARDVWRWDERAGDGGKG